MQVRRLRARLHHGSRSRRSIVGARFQLIRGKCDSTDEGWVATLVRECQEQSQVRVVRDSVAFLGHQVVTGDPRAAGPYLQVRLFGMTEAVGPSAPDPDSGYTYRRLMTSATRAARLLAWGRAGEQQAQAAGSPTPSMMDVSMLPPTANLPLTVASTSTAGTAPTGLVRCLFGPPSVGFTTLEPGTHGCIADGGSPGKRLGRRPRWPAAQASGRRIGL
jgi:hypothetical protein